MKLRLFFILSLGIVFLFLFRTGKVLAVTCTNCSTSGGSCEENYPTGCGNMKGQDGVCNYSGPGTGEWILDFACNAGYRCASTFNCTPIPPGCTISQTGTISVGTAYLGITANFSAAKASPNYVNYNRTQIYYSPVGPSNAWVNPPVCDNSTTSPYSCSGGVNFPSLGSYWVVCNAYSSPTPYPNMSATGNPWCWGVQPNPISCPGWTDAGGGSRMKVNVVQDTTGPEIISLTPTAVNPSTANLNSPSNANAITFTANVTDPQSGLVSVAMAVNSDPNGGTNGTWIALPNASPGPCLANGTQTAFNCSQTWWTNTGNNDGKHAIQVIAIDRSGNKTQNDAFTYYTIDKTPPTFTSLVANPSSPAYASQVNLSSVVSDAVSGITTSGISQIDLYVNKDPNGGSSLSWDWIGTCYNQSSCNTTWIVNKPGYSPGTTHAIVVNVTDKAGNFNSGGWYVGSDPSKNGKAYLLYTLSSSYVCN